MFKKKNINIMSKRSPPGPTLPPATPPAPPVEIFCSRKVGVPRFQVEPLVGVAKVHLTTKASACRSPQAAFSSHLVQNEIMESANPKNWQIHVTFADS